MSRLMKQVERDDLRDAYVMDRKAVAKWLCEQGYVWSTYDVHVRKPSKDLRTLEDCLAYLGITFADALRKARAAR